MDATRERVRSTDQHREVVDLTTTDRPKVLMVVANPTELTHPYYAFTRVRYEVVIASPQGGQVKVDTLSDPRDESKWSAEDLISMGFLNTPELVALLENTPKLADLDLDEFAALVVCGGLAPMFQFRQDEELKKVIVAFYEAEKPTAVLCHGVAALIDVRLSDGAYLVEDSLDLATCEGAATIGLELVRDDPGLDVVLVAVGGGALGALAVEIDFVLRDLRAQHVAGVLQLTLCRETPAEHCARAGGEQQPGELAHTFQLR